MGVCVGVEEMTCGVGTKDGVCTVKTFVWQK